MGNPGDWSASIAMNSTSLGSEVFDIVRLGLKMSDSNSLSANATVFQTTNEWAIPKPDGSKYNNNVGVLGLGASQNTVLGGILQLMKEASDIGSTSFGLHIGSVLCNLSGSLILGGFDSSRVLGQVGVFQYRGSQSSPAQACLLAFSVT